jgi:hypothetical protein
MEIIGAEQHNAENTSSPTTPSSPAPPGNKQTRGVGTFAAEKDVAQQLFS